MNQLPDVPDAGVVTDEPKPGRRRGCLRFCVCVLFVLFVVWVSIEMWWIHALKSERAALRAAGEPVTWAEVIASIEPIPDEENSALLIEPHLSSMLEGEGTPAGAVVTWRRNAALGTRRSDEMLKLMRVLMAEQGPTMAALHEAARRPHGRWPVEASPDVNEHVLDFLTGVRSAGRLLDVEAELRAAEGNGHGAAESVRAVRRVAASLAEGPHYIDLLVRVAIGALTCGSAEDALALGDLPAEDLVMLREEFAAEAQQLRQHTALRGERAALLWMTTEGRSHTFARHPMGSAKWVFRAQVLIPGHAERDAISGLKYTAKLYALLDRPPRELLAGVEALRAECWGGLGRLRNPLFIAFSPLVVLTFPVMSESVVAGKQRMHIARAALAVEQFRTERARWPEKLADLVPDYLDAVPQDWFAPAGTTITYAQTPTGVRLWSQCGKNRIGLTKTEWEVLQELAMSISEFYDAEERCPKSLDELVPEHYESVPVDSRTGKPFTYVTNASNPEMFILGGFKDGRTEEKVWALPISTDMWAHRHWAPKQTIVFRLLNPALRGATQARFADEVDAAERAENLHALGYTPERLKELGFSADDVDEYKLDIEGLELKDDAPRQQPGPPDTPVEPAP